MTSTKIPLQLGVLDLDTGQIEGTSIRLTKTERRLMTYLTSVEHACSPEELLTEVWGYREGVRSRTVYSTINRVRSKIERDAKDPVHLINEEPGYRFCPLRARRPGPELVGRATEQRQVLGRLEAGPVALVGPGGIGKTALAQAVAAVSPVPDQLWVDLRDLQTADEARDRIADRLQLTGDGIEEALELRAPLLLVLDDLDALRDRAALIEPLAAVPGIQLLCTCRGEGVPGCTPVALHPLEPEAARSLLTRNARGHYGDADLDALGEQLGRLPLALCLASQWLDALGTQVFASEPLRLPGLRGSIERSWQRLSPAAQAMIAGIADLGAVVPVELVLRFGELSALAELTSLALVQAEDGWIELSGPVREFAREHAPPDDLLERAARWVQQTCAAVRGALFTPEQPAQVRRFRRARSLVLALLDRLGPSVAAGPLVDVVEVALHTGAVRGLERRVASAAAQSEGVLRAELLIQQARLRLVLAGRAQQEVLELDADALPPSTRGRYAHYRCSLALQQGALDEALDWVAGELDRVEMGALIYRRLLFCRAKAHRRRGEVDEAMDWLQELELLALEADDPVHQMSALALRGSTAKQLSRFDQARASLSAARERAGDLELWASRAHLTVALAQVLTQTASELEEATTMLEEAETYYLQTGQRRSLGYVHLGFTSLFIHQLDFAAAVQAARVAVRHFRHSQDHIAHDHARGTLARALIADDDAEAAIVLLDGMLEHASTQDRPTLDALRALGLRVLDTVGVPFPRSLLGHPAEATVRRLLRPGTPPSAIRAWLGSSAFDRELGVV